jgi:hypothetical protein
LAISFFSSSVNSFSLFSTSSSFLSSDFYFSIFSRISLSSSFLALSCPSYKVFYLISSLISESSFISSSLIFFKSSSYFRISSFFFVISIRCASVKSISLFSISSRCLSSALAFSRLSCNSFSSLFFASNLSWSDWYSLLKLLILSSSSVMSCRILFNFYS